MGSWLRDAVIYQIYIRSFADGDGDGIGDIAGVRSRLSYLANLGVDGIWINPWYPSGQADGGYDVVDYRTVDPAFGELAEAENLLRAAHEHGLRVLLDVVPNHTSDQHPWFRAAVASASGSPQRSRYVFSPGRGEDGSLPPTNWQSMFGGPAWTRLSDGEWYLHLFAPEQPDLNWENPEIHEEFEAILRFWFDRGVDGFRIDVAHGLIKDPAFPDLPDDAPEPSSTPFLTGHPAFDQEGVHEIYRAWRKIADSYQPARVLVGEAWVKPAERLARYVRDDELHNTFNFDLLRAEWDSSDMRAAIDETTHTLAAVGASASWVLSNHDVVRHVTRYGRARGHENDAAGVVPSDIEQGTRRARAAALLQLALPGGVYLYQGDELGLPEVEDLPEAALHDPVWERSGRTDRGRDGCRVPLPWSGERPPYGFGEEASWLPQPESWRRYTGSKQSSDPDSTFQLYRTALRVRRAEPELGDGDLRWLKAPDNVLFFARGTGFACMVNLSDRPVGLPSDGIALLASGALENHVLPTDHAAWLRIKPGSSLVRSG